MEHRDHVNTAEQLHRSHFCPTHTAEPTLSTGPSRCTCRTSEAETHFPAGPPRTSHLSFTHRFISTRRVCVWWTDPALYVYAVSLSVCEMCVFAPHHKLVVDSTWYWENIFALVFVFVFAHLFRCVTHSNEDLKNARMRSIMSYILTSAVSEQASLTRIF